MRLVVLIASLALAGTAFAEDEHKPVKITKEVDKSSPLLMSTGNTDPVNDDEKDGVRRPIDATSGKSTGRRQHGAANLHAEGIVHRDVATRSAEAPANHNTTRSNRTAPHMGGGGGAGKANAQDYNSSRSNNINGEANSGGKDDCIECSCNHLVANGGGVDDDCDSVEDTAARGKRNVLRVRTTTTNVDVDSTDGPTRAPSNKYNSSRSNTDGIRLDPDSDGDRLREVRCSQVSDACVDAGDDGGPVVRKKPGKK